MPYDSHAIEQLLRSAVERVQSARSLPESTYRVQFHAGFTFRDVTRIIPYLSKLGITHLYASPYLKAKPGSQHGYDVIDHCKLNPELGTTDDYEAMLASLREHRMSHILDMVPNHVGIATNDNVWWNDVLENGPASLYGKYFDINWAGSPQTELQGRVLIPTLGGQYGEVLEKGELQLNFENGVFFVSFHERRFPVSPRRYDQILSHGISSLAGDEAALRDLRSIIADCSNLPDRSEGPTAAADRHRAKEEIKRRLAKLCGQSEAVRNAIAANVKAFNGIAGKSQSFDEFDHLLRHQCYRLAYWRTAPDEINYRRFFDVNDLAALAMERLEVFEATHVFILDLLARNKIGGLRIDHPDGLYDPKTYFQRLQKHYVLGVAREIAKTSPQFGSAKWDEIRPLLLERLDRDIPVAGTGAMRWPLYVVGEKILAMDETLPKTWAVNGTSGYEFLNMINGLFVDTSAAEVFTQLYHRWIGDETSFSDIVYRKKKLILEISLSSELHMLAGELKRIAGRDRYALDFSLNGLLVALKEVIACFPVYRSYITGQSVSGSDRAYVEEAINSAIKLNPTTEPSIFHFIRDVLLLKQCTPADADDHAARLHFAGKFQQLTSPVTAKGIEDTAFYIYNRLLSLNEVGGNPSHFGVTAPELHKFLAERQQDWPYAMSTLSTHDTKRSEDVRARLNVLSEIPDQWREAIERWGNLNAGRRTMIDGKPVPDRNEEYALYQTLIGAWPLDSTAPTDEFIKRIQACMQKSMREAKVHTRWTDPNADHEAAVEKFIETILRDSAAEDFRKDFQAFQRVVSQFGLFNSLSQTLLKLTAPGVPDTYQGTELWDFSLVDPDNRRPVDFERRVRLFDEIAKRDRDIRQLLDSREDGRIKLFVHEIALKARNEHPGSFSIGQYIPLQTSAGKGQHIFAFARSHGDRVAVVAVPRLIARLLHGKPGLPCGKEIWGDASVAAHDLVRGRKFRSLFSGNVMEFSPSKTSADWPAAQLFSDFPLALLISE